MVKDTLGSKGRSSACLARFMLCDVLAVAQLPSCCPGHDAHYYPVTSSR
jgi:hypothetical protein